MMQTERDEIKYAYMLIRHNHLLWREMFLDCCQNENPPLVINRLSNPRECECGKLLHETLFFRLYANVPGIAELEQEHTRLHDIAKRLLEQEMTTTSCEQVIHSSDKFLEILDSIHEILTAKAIIRKTLHPIKTRQVFI